MLAVTKQYSGFMPLISCGIGILLTAIIVRHCFYQMELYVKVTLIYGVDIAPSRGIMITVLFINETKYRCVPVDP